MTTHAGRTYVACILAWSFLSDMVSMFGASIALSPARELDLYGFLLVRSTATLICLRLVWQRRRVGWWSTAGLLSASAIGLSLLHWNRNPLELHLLTSSTQLVAVMICLHQAIRHPSAP